MSDQQHERPSGSPAPGLRSDPERREPASPAWPRDGDRPRDTEAAEGAPVEEEPELQRAVADDTAAAPLTTEDEEDRGPLAPRFDEPGDPEEPEEPEEPSGEDPSSA